MQRLRRAGGALLASSTIIPSGSTMDHRPPVLVVCGPSGVGKGTILQNITNKYASNFAKSISHTSRNPRPGEMNAVDYYFVDKQEILNGVANGEFLEHALVHGNVYGTSKKAVQDVQNNGKICLLEIDIQGAEQIKQAELDPKPRFVFVSPPSVEELEKRLRKRNTETEEKISIRLKNALKEMESMQKDGFYDAVIVNDNLEKAIQEFEEILQNWYPSMF
jgi:guanylate kinase